MALGPWCTHDYRAARPLRDSVGHRDSSEKEREEVVGVLTNRDTWRWSCADGHTTMLNREGWWCSDREMVPDARRDWSQVDVVDNGSALVAPFIGP
jgi:hypothetical protein